MPTIEISKKHLEKLVGCRFNASECFEKLKIDASGKGDRIQAKIEDTNRIDLFSVEGIARAIRALKGAKKSYKIDRKPAIEIYAKDVPARPYIAASVIENAGLDNERIKDIMKFQEVLDMSIGRDRKKTSIGLYKFKLIKPPLVYKTINNIEFVPLGYSKKMDLKQILAEHPKGKEYGRILKNEKYPIFMDSKNQVLSFPPIINSNSLGRIDKDTDKILIEVTGTHKKTVNNVLKIMSFAFLERGAKMSMVRIKYKNSEEITPILEEETIELDLNYLKRISELEEIDLELFKKFDYEIISSNKRFVKLKIPLYRQDVMHQIDVIEDYLIAYGYENIIPELPEIPTAGRMDESRDRIRTLCVGAGLQEVSTYIMVPDNLFEKPIMIENPVNNTKNAVRPEIYPNLIEFLSKNTHEEYPQNIFEIGEVVDRKGATRKNLSIALCGNSSFTDIKQILDFISAGLCQDYALEKSDSAYFIPGRVSNVLVGNLKKGIIGEIHPKILEEKSIFQPIFVLELEI